MTLDSAITYYEEIAKDCRRKADIERNDYMDMRDSASEAEQLASWLNELKLLRGRIDVQPERKPGKWIEDDDGWDGVLWRCSECAELLCIEDGTPEENEYHFCPFCGADMRGNHND